MKSNQIPFSTLAAFFCLTACDAKLQVHTPNQPSPKGLPTAPITSTGPNSLSGYPSFVDNGNQSILPAPSAGHSDFSGNGQNPYEGSLFFVNPEYSSRVLSTVAQAPDLSDKLNKIASTSTAYWVDKKAAITGLNTFLAAASQQSQQLNKQVVATIVVYNLPDRDCAALASNGELSGQAGLNEYFGYIDQVAGVVNSYPNVRVSAIIEPDSLPNVVTNQGQRRCTGEVLNNYKTGVVYAIQKLQAPNISLYIDAAHSGWLGWGNNRSGAAQVMGEVLQRAGGIDKIRGFSTNVANYSVLQFDYNQPSPWYDQSNPARDELTYVQLFSQDLSSSGITGRHFIIDTSRNGVQNSRQIWGSWCNVANAGIGKAPTVNPATNVDAYVWVKPPGESDGTSDYNAPRHDAMCNNQDALTPAPEAGTWFPQELIRLTRNS